MKTTPDSYYPSIWVAPILPEVDTGWIEMRSPICNLLLAHETTRKVVQAAANRERVGLLDVRYPRHPNKYSMDEDGIEHIPIRSVGAFAFSKEDSDELRPYVLDYASRAFGGLDTLWEKFLSMVESHGALASQISWPSDWNFNGEEWMNIPLERLEPLEEEFLSFLGYGLDYPSHNTRRQFILRPVNAYLIEEFSDRILSDSKHREMAAQVIEKTLEIRVCVACGREYQLIRSFALANKDLDWLDTCCLHCPPLYPSEDQILYLIRDLIDACGFVPPKSFFFPSVKSVRQVGKDRFGVTMKALRNLGGIDHAASFFEGDWRRAVKAAKALR